MIPRKRSSSDASDITKKVAGSTKRGKDFIIDQNTSGYFFIKFSDGGKLPKTMKGRFTKYEEAQYVIDSYLRGG